MTLKSDDVAKRMEPTEENITLVLQAAAGGLGECDSCAGLHYYAPIVHIPEYTASIDAALALVERVLPGWHVELTHVAPCRRVPAGGNWATLTPQEWDANYDSSHVASLPLAILSALLSAIESNPALVNSQPAKTL